MRMCGNFGKYRENRGRQRAYVARLPIGIEVESLLYVILAALPEYGVPVNVHERDTLQWLFVHPVEYGVVHPAVKCETAAVLPGVVDEDVQLPGRESLEYCREEQGADVCCNRNLFAVAEEKEGFVE